MSGVSPITRVLRSDCRKHGTGSCTCPSEQLPATPRRRSSSRTPSRASSVAPELTHSPSTESSSSSHYIANGSITNLSGHETNYFQTSQSYKKQSYEETFSRTVRSRLEEELQCSSSSSSSRDQQQRSISTTNLSKNDRLNVRSAFATDDNEDFLTRERLKRQERSVSASPRLATKHRTEKDTSSIRQKVAYNIIDEGAESDEIDGDESTLNLNSSMASSLSSSFRSASAHDRSRLNSSCRVASSTTTTTTAMNGNHAEKHHRLISVLRSGSVARGEGDSLVATSSSIGYSWESYSLIQKFRSGMESAWSGVQYAVLCLPRWIYWTLVNLFVCEKWFLHQRSTVSGRELLRKLLLFLLLLLLGASLYSYAGFFTSMFPRPVIFPSPFPKVDEPVPDPPPVPRSISEGKAGSSDGSPSGGFFGSYNSFVSQTPSCPDLAEQKADYERLVAKVAVLEQMAEEYKRTAEEHYSQHLNEFKQSLEIKIREEILKIEPSKTTVVVEKHTVVEKPIVPPPVEPEPINIDKLSNTLMPLILPLIMDKVKAQIEEVKVECPDCKTVEPSESASVPLPGFSGLDLSEVEKMIRAAIGKYDADKTGLPDLALEPAGGTILSTRCTKSSQSKNSVLTLWGWRVWSFSNSPRTIIQPGVVPGECWVVEGATAEVVIQLIAPAIITGFTLEHIPKSISPYGKIDTAPRKFQVVGLMHENDVENGWDYGTFEYLDNDEPIQYFPVQNKTAVPYPIVELRVLSNHGSVRSTCIYRFRVHGENIERTT